MANQSEPPVLYAIIRWRPGLRGIKLPLLAPRRAWEALGYRRFPPRAFPLFGWRRQQYVSLELNPVIDTSVRHQRFYSGGCRDRSG